MDVREVYFYCLAFGFHGKYYSDAGIAELNKIKQDNYQLLSQNQGDLSKGEYWFSQSPINTVDSQEKFKNTGWAVMFGVPTLLLVALIAWYRLDLLNSINTLIKSF